MLVYRSEKRIVETRELIERLSSLAWSARSHETARESLIEAGVLESAVVDALHPERDGTSAPERELRATTVAAARWLLAVLDGNERRAEDAQHLVRQRASQLPRLRLPSLVEERPPEGYVHYGLYPEAYADAARQLLRALGPTRVTCLGLRSIGTGLAAIVAATLEAAGVEVRSFTVRPRGPAFARTLRLDPSLARALADTNALHLVVDEGPGLSGSSFAACTRTLRELGGAPERIVVFPSWDADGDRFVSTEARQEWRRHRRFVGAFDERALIGGDALVDWSAGRWRAAVCDGVPWPAVQPQHERRKLVDEERGRLDKFVGFGRWGRARVELEARVARAGFGPRPDGIQHGFLRRPLVDGKPLARVDGGVLDEVARYLAFRRTLVVAAPLDLAPLVEMARQNVAELVGETALAGVEAAARRAQAAEARSSTPAVHVDGRLAPHEWLAGARLWKVDAVDHGDDHFFPGPTDVAWDVAGALVELAPAAAARARLIEAMRAVEPTIDARLPFFELAYLAHRAAYARLAADTLAGCDDGARFVTLADRYRAQLCALLFRR